MEIILEKIKTITSQKRITIAEVERRAELSNGTIARWNKVTPRIDSVLKVAEVLNVSLDYLVKGIEENKNSTSSSIIGNNNNGNVINGSGCIKLSKQEEMMVDIYRKLDAIQQIEIFQKVLEMSKFI